MSTLLLDLLRGMSTGNWRMVSRGKKGEEWAGPCPVCGGNDRFRAWPTMAGGDVCREAGISGSWWCRQCDRGGDVISLLEFARGLDFVGACKDLGIGLSAGPRQPQSRPLRQPRVDSPWEPKAREAPPEKWQIQASKLTLEAAEYLLSYADGLKYLAGRGLPLAAVKEYSLGYLTGDDKSGLCRYRARSAFDLADKQVGDRVKKALWIPRGLTIPLWGSAPQGGSMVHRLRIRRRAADLTDGRGSKFLLLEGSGQAPMILLPTKKAVDRTAWVIVEAELDAMAVHQACAGQVGVIAVLTNRGKPDVTAHGLLKSAPTILVALDFDEADAKGHRAGYEGWSWWEKIYIQAKRWPVPQGKDPGEAFGLGVDLARWVGDGYPQRPVAPAPMEQKMEAGPPIVTAVVDLCPHDVAAFVDLLEKHKAEIPTCVTRCFKTGAMVNILGVCMDCPSVPVELIDYVMNLFGLPIDSSRAAECGVEVMP